MRISQYPVTIQNHLRDYQDAQHGEKAWFDKILRYHNGEFWTGRGNVSEVELQKMSLNLIYAVTDSALATLVPPNPRISAKPRNRANQNLVASAEDVVNLALASGNYRRELGTTTFSTVLYGRGVTKTVWNPKTDLPLVRNIDVRNLFFDRVATRPEDIRYWIEVTLVGEEEYEKRVAAGKYDPQVAKNYRADTFPKWMLPDDNASGGGTWDDVKLRNFQRWHVIYECYDMESGKVMHFCPEATEPLFQQDMVYLPYDLVVFNSNGRDCLGLSEIGLILPNQEEYNLLATYLHNIVRYQIGRMGYDANAMDVEKAFEINKTPLGGMTPFNIKPEIRNAHPGIKGSDLVWELPTVHAQPEQMDLLARLREGIAYVSALADAQRGQVVGARTATELALIEGQLRNRLRNRQGALDELTTSVAEKCLLLASKYMKKEKVLEITGEEGWKEITPWDIATVEARFEMVAYSPAESNKAVRAEIMRSLMDAFVNNPQIDQRNFFSELLKLLDLPATILADPQAVAAHLAAQGQPAPGAPPPGGPLPAPADPNAVPLPPQVQALADAQVAGPQGPVPSGSAIPGGGPVTTPAPV